MPYIAVITIIFLTELCMKGYVEKHGEEGTTKPLCGGKLLLQKYHNQGAFLNFGEKKKKAVAAVSVILTLLALLLFIFTLGTKGNVFLKTGLSFLLGGAFSNTYDRIFRKYVVDYLSFQVKCKPLRQVVFNIADFFVITGALICAVKMSA